MTVMSLSRAKEVAAQAYDELGVPIGSPLEQVTAVFRALCLRRAMSVLSGSGVDSTADNNDAADSQAEHDGGAERFERQVVAFRFLSSLPLIDTSKQTPTESRIQSLNVLAMLHPLRPLSAHEGHARASAMLDVSIASLERAQRAGGLPYTNYVLTVHYCLRKHVVRRRYGEFLALNNLLSSQLPVLPELPPKDWKCHVGDMDAVTARASGLTQYLMRVIALLSTRGLFSLDIMNFLEIDITRVRAEEEAFASALLARSQGDGDGSQVFYMLHAGWLDAWKRFVTGGGTADSPPPPGPITNDHLLDGGRSKKAKNHLALKQHYRCVNASTWRYLHAVYGGGPAIPRRSPFIYDLPNYDLTTLSVHIQRIVRGFLGRCEARHRKQLIKQQTPAAQRQLARLAQNRELAERMAVVSKFVAVKEFQARHVAAIKIQRQFRRHNLRAEHALLLAESAVPDSGAVNQLQQVEDHLSLAELALVSPEPLRLAHFLVALTKGVPLRKLRSRRKSPAWRLFKLDSIGSQLLWTSKRKRTTGIEPATRSLAFVDVVSVQTESPLRLKLGFRAVAQRRPTTFEFATVVTYHESSGPIENDEDAPVAATGPIRELMLVCESAAEMEALEFGLRALVTEAAARVADGATYVDGHGVIRKKFPHAKRLLRAARDLLVQSNQLEH